MRADPAQCLVHGRGVVGVDHALTASIPIKVRQAGVDPKSAAESDLDVADPVARRIADGLWGR